MNSYREPVIITYKETMHKGPFKKCPACGISLLYKLCTRCVSDFDYNSAICPHDDIFHRADHISVCWHSKASPKYCDTHNRFVIKKGFFKNIRCAIAGKHIHQSCYCCGWSGIADPENEDA